jgi:hypothetical protein
MTRKSGISLIVGMLFGLFLSLGSVQAGEAVEGTAKADKLDQCVAPTAEMRRNHFEMIKHQRDLTVHHGVRANDDALAKCVDCHARKDVKGHHVPVDGEGQFCSGCHAYVAVQISCFSCHASVPGDK